MFELFSFAREPAPVVPLPTPGSLWKHKNGNHYVVRFLTNDGGLRKGHPVDVVYYTQGYENDPAKQWSRRLRDWSRSFTFIEATP